MCGNINVIFMFDIQLLCMCIYVCVTGIFRTKSTPGGRFLGQFPQDIILHPD